MRISYTGEVQKIREAAAFVNELAGQDNFWRQVREKPKFDYTDLLSGEIERRLRAAGTTLTVQIWRPSNFYERLKYRKTVAFVDHEYPHHLFYHEKFIDNDTQEYVHTLVHEYVHDVDNHSDGSTATEMGHGSNSPVGKQDSAPYWIGNLAQRCYVEATGQLDLVKITTPSLVHETGNVADGEIVSERATPLRSFTTEASPG